MHNLSAPLQSLLQNHADILVENRLVAKAQRQVVERAGARSVEDDLIEGVPGILRSTFRDTTAFYLAFRLPDGRLKLVLLGNGRSEAESSVYVPAAGSYFTEQDCQLADRLASELDAFSSSTGRSYDVEYGIERCGADS